jgi:hypothetical protein
VMGHSDKLTTARDPYGHPSGRERDDRCDGDPALRVRRAHRQKMVGQTLNTHLEQIGVGVHSRRPRGQRAARQSVANFDAADDSFNSTTTPFPVALLI